MSRNYINLFPEIVSRLPTSSPGRYSQPAYATQVSRDVPGFRSFISRNSSRAACNLDREIFATRKRNRSIQMSSVCFLKQPQSNLHPQQEDNRYFQTFHKKSLSCRCGPPIICRPTKVSCCRWRLPFSKPNNFSMSIGVGLLSAVTRVGSIFQTK